MSRPIRREVKITMMIFSLLAASVGVAMALVERPFGVICWMTSAVGLGLLALAFGD